MDDATPLLFSAADCYVRLDGLDDNGLDALNFGVIAFDSQTLVRRYNAFERKHGGLLSSQVLGLPLFTVVAPCMNNFLVAQPFEDAASRGDNLDATINYVLTLRMRPVKVSLRLLASPSHRLRYVLVSERQR